MIETRVEKIEASILGIFYKIYIIDGKEFMFVLDEEEFDKLITQMEKAKNE